MNALEAALATVLSRHGVYSQPLIRELYEEAEGVLGRDHICVVAADYSWVIEHSLECRLTGKMVECHYNYDLNEFGTPPKAGRYRLSWDYDGVIDYEPVEATT